MTEREIIIDWLSMSENTKTFITIEYEKEFFKFLISTHHVVSNINGIFCKVGDSWIKIKEK